MPAFTALLFLTASAAGPEPLDPSQGRVWPGVAAGWVRACGFQDVELSYDGTLQEYVIHVRGAADVTDQQLGCAARASLNSDQYVDFPEPLNRRYQQLYWPLAEDSGRQEARAWLARHGLLKKLPHYVQGKTDAFAHELEHLCGPAANGAFAVEDGIIVLKEAKRGRRRELRSETFDCLTNALWASGLPLGIAANEYYPSNE